MLRSRIIPCLLVHNQGLVKTIRFKDPKYVGDPINAVRIFNEKEADELIVLDIDASVQGREPNFSMIEKLATECRMPLCYGGGIKTPDQAERIINLGVEKVAFGSLAIENAPLLYEIGSRIGIQSVVVILDVKQSGIFGNPELYMHNGKTRAKAKFNDKVAELSKIGIGELVINSIDRDGTMKGYDQVLVHKIRGLIEVPLTILGGAASLENILELINFYGPIGAAAGSLFVFKGKYRAVLINYPSSGLERIKI